MPRDHYAIAALGVLRDDLHKLRDVLFEASDITDTQRVYVDQEGNSVTLAKQSYTPRGGVPLIAYEVEVLYNNELVAPEDKFTIHIINPTANIATNRQAVSAALDHFLKTGPSVSFKQIYAA